MSVSPVFARPVTRAEYLERWERSFQLVFDTGGGFYGVEQWTDMVYRPGYTFTFLDGRVDPFPDPTDYDRLCAFARSVGDSELLALYPLFTGVEPESNPGSAVVASIVSTAASWEEVKSTTTEGVDLPGINAPLTFGPGVGDFYLWSPRTLWGVVQAEDAGVAIAGTWGPAITTEFRTAFEVAGDGWTARLEEDYADFRSGAGGTGPIISDLYRRP